MLNKGIIVFCFGTKLELWCHKEAEMKGLKSFTALILALALLLTLCLSAGAFTPDKEAANLEGQAAKYVLSCTPSAGVDSIGGEWAVIGLARGFSSAPDSYFDSYYSLLEQHLRDCGGVLHRKKYTEYSRVILAVTAIGRDARSVAGYDLTLPLGDYEATVFQGINGAIWALIALDSANYPVPQNGAAKTQATRGMYINYILASQNADGGWSLSGGESDADLTAMALQALSKYTDAENVSASINKGFDYLSAAQLSNGAFTSDGVETAESCAQVLVALCENGISVSDGRFVKNGNSVLDALLDFFIPGAGFKHSRSDSSSGQMASEQGLYALAAYNRISAGMSSLYSMSADGSGNSGGFADVSGHKNQAAIEALAERGIIKGRTETSFAPDELMNRAEFSTIMARALGLEPDGMSVFSDVSAEKWYAPYVSAAYTAGIVNGVGGNRFAPEITITRQEAAVMAARAARMCGIETETSSAGVSTLLSKFDDGDSAASWAEESLAFCYSSGLLPEESSILPEKAILRCEIAQLLYELLSLADLL